MRRRYVGEFSYNVSVMLDSHDLSVMRFSTDAVPPGDRIEAWRDILTRKLLPIAVDPLSGSPFRAAASLRILPGLRVGSGLIGPSLNHRTREIVARENDDVALLVNLSGPLVFLRRGADVDLGLGDACLIDCSETSAFVQSSAGRLMCIRVENTVIAPYARGLREALGRVIPAETGALKLLLSYVRILHGPGAVQLSTAESRVVADQVAELVALVVSQSGSAVTSADSRAVRAARLNAVKAYVAERLAAPELSLDEVAAHEGVSPRYVRKLFEGEGQSFSGYVAGERLARAHGMLANPLLSHLPVSSVAFDVGFGDLSYFNRLFRQRYHATPSEIRSIPA